MKWFDAGTKTMSSQTFGKFIKLIKLQCTLYRVMGLTAGQTHHRIVPRPWPWLAGREWA